MAKPPPSPPSSDIEGVHRDRRARDTLESGATPPQDAFEPRQRENIGRPVTGVGEALGRASSRLVEPEEKTNG